MKHLEETVKFLIHIQYNPTSTQGELIDKTQRQLRESQFLYKSSLSKRSSKNRKLRNLEEKRAYLYVLTPKSISEKVVITNKFLELEPEEDKKLKIKIKNLKVRGYNGDRLLNFHGHFPA